ncbi:hypothetical protein Nepgr_017794 [Nepenthes gracilis]|uniref:Uncharacterized protein n=1 Tax=Nepenthes gracilis TaxID=150966 RepID=A0AAD3SR46_NEPGR|nr:hypothetical protein Nepgr_017794 [Nepenthes gracilis]
MQARGNYRLILNPFLYPDMKLPCMDKRGITYACVNSGAEGKIVWSIFALKFKDGSVVWVLHKGEATPAMKTLENLPNASGF